MICRRQSSLVSTALLVTILVTASACTMRPATAPVSESVDQVAAPSASENGGPDKNAYEGQSVPLTEYGSEGRWRGLVVSATVRGYALVVRVNRGPTPPQERAIRLAAEAAHSDLGLPVDHLSIVYDETGFVASFGPLD